MSVKISALPAAANANLTDEFEANQSGTTRKVTANQIKAIPPSITQNAGAAFGVQQNNTTGKTLIVVVTLQILYDFTLPGTQQIDVITNSTNPAPMAQMLVQQASSTTTPLIFETITIVVAPGGWYQINNTFDPSGGNSIVAVWEVAL